MVEYSTSKVGLFTLSQWWSNHYGTGQFYVQNPTVYSLNYCEEHQMKLHFPPLPCILIRGRGQIENEYGSYGNDKTYLQHLVTLARKYFGEKTILSVIHYRHSFFASDGKQLQFCIIIIINFTQLMLDGNIILWTTIDDVLLDNEQNVQKRKLIVISSSSFFNICDQCVNCQKQFEALKHGH